MVRGGAFVVCAPHGLPGEPARRLYLSLGFQVAEDLDEDSYGEPRQRFFRHF